MTTFNTGNQIGSVDPRDLYDNAENLDTAVNTKTDTTWTDRLGVERKTFHGMEVQFDSQQVDFEDRFNVALQGIGYDRIGEYGAGLEINEYNQIFRREDAPGQWEWYAPSPSLELPYTTTGDWGDEEGLFVAVGDAALRGELAQPDGAEKIGFSETANLKERVLYSIYPEDFGAFGNGVNDDTSALIAWALDQSGRAKYLKSGSTYLTDQPIDIKTNVFGNGATILYSGSPTQSIITLSSDNIVVLDVNVRLQGGASTNPDHYGDNGGAGFLVMGSGCLVERSSVVDMPNGVDFFPADGNIVGGLVRDCRINSVSRGLAIYRTGFDPIEFTAQGITSQNNRYTLQEDSLPVGAEIEGASGLLIKWPSEGFKSINDVIRNTAEHGVYFQGVGGYFENIDMEKPDSPSGDGLKISCPDGGFDGIGRFASAVVKGIKSRGYRCGYHAQFRVQDSKVEGVDIDVTGNTLAANDNSYGLRSSDPSDQSKNLILKDFNIKGGRRGALDILMGGMVSIQNGRYENSEAEDDVAFRVDKADYFNIDNVRAQIGSPDIYALYVGNRMNYFGTISNFRSRGGLPILVNGHVTNRVSIYNTTYGNSDASHYHGGVMFNGDVSSTTVQPFGGRFFMPSDGIAKKVAIRVEKIPSSGSFTFSIRRNYVEVLQYNMTLALIGDGLAVIPFAIGDLIYFEAGDIVQVAIGKGSAVWDGGNNIFASLLFN